MAQHRVTLPRVSETIDEFYVVEWLVEVGGTVAADEPLLRVETDKAIVDIPSPVAGTLVERLVELDAEVKTGEEVAVVEG